MQEWNRKYAYPKIVFSSNTEWFEALEKAHGHQLKTVSGDGGSGASSPMTALPDRSAVPASISVVAPCRGALRDDIPSADMPLPTFPRARAKALSCRCLWASPATRGF